MMNLNETPEIVQFTPVHYIFNELIGPFMQTAQKAWGEVGKVSTLITDQNTKLGAMALYKIRPQMIYRAGIVVAKKPEVLPAGFQYEYFTGGKYSCFTLKGSYAQLPEASGRVMKIAEDRNIEITGHWFIENYLNDPSTTAEAELVTQIMVPTK